MSSLLAAACGPSWPQSATAVAAPQTPHSGAQSIDILPADLQLWADEAVLTSPDTAEQLRAGAEAVLMKTTAASIAHTGRTFNVLDWAGNANGQLVMDPRELDETEASLSGYGALAEASPHYLPIPYLPARLGTVTGADATLYVGGWAFVGKRDHTSMGVKIAEGVLIGVALVAVVVVIAAMSKGGHGGGLGHLGGGHGGGGGAHVASGGSHGGTSVGGKGGGGRSGGGGSVVDPGNVNVSSNRSRENLIANGTGRGVYPHPYPHPAGGADDVADLADVVDTAADAFGRMVTIPVRPDYPSTGPQSGKSAMYLEMTLVDNHSGLPIWHARQTFPAGADSPKEVARVARTMLASMPH